MKFISPSFRWYCLIAIVLLISFSSCSETNYFILGKKYTWYNDYSDQKKEAYYTKNKTAIDAILVLSSNKTFQNFINFKHTSTNYQASFYIDINKNFFDTTTNNKNIFWMEYVKVHREDVQELSGIITKMMELTKKIHPLFHKQFKENSIRIAKNSMLIPLKRIKRDNYLGEEDYSVLIIFDTAKTNIANVKLYLYNYPPLKMLSGNLMTNEAEKR